MYGVVDCEGGGDQDFFDVGVVVGVPPELLVNGPPESFNLSIGAGVVATCSDSIDAQGGVEVIDDFGGKIEPAVCGDFGWDADEVYDLVHEESECGGWALGSGDAGEEKLAKCVGGSPDVKLLASTMEGAMKIHMDVGQERTWLLLYLQWSTLFCSA